MIWWDWKTSQRLLLVAAMLVVAAVPTILLAGFTNNLRAVMGGTAFFFIPQMMGWVLFVGLTTGRMPTGYGRSALRTESPASFWITGAVYAGVLLFFVWIIVGVIILGS